MKNKTYYLLVTVCILLFLAACTSKKVAQNESQQTTTNSVISEITQKSSVPTLFIHGYGGGSYSFGRMIDRLSENDQTQKELVLTVNAKGEVKADGELTGKEDNPSIQIIFEDNKNTEWNQAQWLKNCLVYIQDKYDLTEVNLVGHSMGGVSSLRYMTSFGGDEHLPKINKFISIAAPFNNFMELSDGETIDDVVNDGPAVQSERYTEYVNGMNKVSKDMDVLIIAGDVEDGSLSDKTVSVADALSVVSLLKKHGNQVQDKIFYGKLAQHSQLHENKDVDQLVADFLWE